MTPTGLLLSDDMLFISRITGTARSLGLEIKPARNAANLLGQAKAQSPACVLVDLQNAGLDIVALVSDLKSAGNPFIVGYGSHVDAATLKAAREAGCDLVLPRSQFVEELATELPSWFQVS
jgi:ActR/RegA family two-component response regulator